MKRRWVTGIRHGGDEVLLFRQAGERGRRRRSPRQTTSPVESTSGTFRSEAPRSTSRRRRTAGDHGAVDQSVDSRCDHRYLEGKLPGFIVPTELIFERHLGWRRGMVVPETSTWAMLALAFGVFGSAAFRQRKMNIAMLPRRPPSFHRADRERQPVEPSFLLLASVDTLGSLAFRPTALSPSALLFECGRRQDGSGWYSPMIDQADPPRLR
jgi:hypothetical protein